MNWKKIGNALKAGLTGVPTYTPQPPLDPPPSLLVPMVPPFGQFTDPTAGAFTLDVPQGWQVRGGFVRAGLGDRRCWYEMLSPDGIHIIGGDAGVPQCFYYSAMALQGQMVPLPAGGMFLNLKPGADYLLDYYLKHNGAQRFGTMQPLKRGSRPDMVVLQQQWAREVLGTPPPASVQLSASEFRFQVNTPQGPRVGSILALASANSASAGMGFMFWEGSLAAFVGTPGQIQLAEYVRRRAIASFRPTQRMFAIIQQDEAAITTNGQIANQAQWSQFNALQSVHRTQESIGDGITSGYWQTQATMDHLSQNRSDAMLGHQQLMDGGTNAQYTVPSGYDYYWLNPQTNQVVGTNTSDPPDNLTNYTALQKM